MDKRSERTKNKIMDSFLKLEKNNRFTEISISILCEEASISRPTFYRYYSSLDDVLNDVIQKLIIDISDSRAELFNCEEALKENKRPMCVALRQSEDFRILIKDSDLTDYIVNYFSKTNTEYLKGGLHKTKLSMSQLDMLNYYKIHGCMAVIRKTLHKTDEEWEKEKETIDAFLMRGFGIRKY